MKASSLLWIKVYLIFPFIPFLVEAFFRITLNQSLCLDSFNASTYALTIALLCLFITQSLLSAGYNAENEEDRAERLGSAETFKFLMLFMFSLFVGLIILDVINGQLSKTPSRDLLGRCLLTIKITAYIFSLLPIYLAFRAQQSFKLSTTI